MKQKRISLIITSVALLVGGFLFVGYPPEAHAAQVNCAILDQSLCNAATSTSTDTKSSGILLLLKWALNILTAGVGIAAVGAYVYAGVMYSSAGGASDRVSQAKKIITDTTVGLVIYALIFFGLQWLLPGGVFG